MSPPSFITPLPLSLSAHPTTCKSISSRPPHYIPSSPSPSILLLQSCLPVPHPLESSVHPGAVAEVFSAGTIHLALITDVYPKGIVAQLLQLSNPPPSSPPAHVKISFGEIISVWPSHLHPLLPDPYEQLVAHLNNALYFLRVSPPRSLDLQPLWEMIRVQPKPRASITSVEASKIVFRAKQRRSVEQQAALAVAASVLLAGDPVRFRRGTAGMGWKAVAGSVAVERGRGRFVETCRKVLEEGKGSRVAWSREELEMLREIELSAASGGNVGGGIGKVLEQLGYDKTDNGAARLLLDMEYWATGKREKKGDAELSWGFPAEVLKEAAQLKTQMRRKRMEYTQRKLVGPNNRGRKVFDMGANRTLRVYCVDDKTSRFLDDAISVQNISDGILRVGIHITDVDQAVKSGSQMDSLARERGQSLYLPLRPLHMFPAAAMEAASFSPVLATEAISTVVDVDIRRGEICNWEVFASVIPPVIRLNYEQLDDIMNNANGAADINQVDQNNLRLLSKITPFLCEKLDQRRNNRKFRTAASGSNGRENIFDDADIQPRGVASVRIMKKRPNSSIKVTEVVDFRESGAHGVVGGLLTCAGALFRQFARENRAYLPEGKGASAYVARCGTAPLRRYSDLATQRQIKCVLFGRQPASRRRMDELRVWLAKRQAAAEKTVTERRKSALFDSLSNHCAQQSAAGGTEYAFVSGRTRSVCITKKGSLKVQVDLDGTGLSTEAVVTGSALAKVEACKTPNGSEENTSPKQEKIASGSRSRGDFLLSKAQALMPLRSKVKVHIHDVDTVAQQIRASVVDIF